MNSPTAPTLTVDGKPIEECDVAIEDGDRITEVNDVLLEGYNMTRESYQYAPGVAGVSDPEMEIDLIGAGITVTDPKPEPDPTPTHPNTRCEPADTVSLVVDGEEVGEVDSFAVDGPDDRKAIGYVTDDTHPGPLEYTGSFEFEVHDDDVLDSLELFLSDAEANSSDATDRIADTMEDTRDRIFEDLIDALTTGTPEDDDVLDGTVEESETDPVYDSETLVAGEDPPETDAEPPSAFDFNGFE